MDRVQGYGLAEGVPAVRYTPLALGTVLRWIPGSGAGCGGSGWNKAWGHGCPHGGSPVRSPGQGPSMSCGTGYRM